MNHNEGFRQRFLKFMQGRYGVDQLSNFLIWTGLFISLFTIFIPIRILIWISWLLIIYANVRIFSRKVQKRYQQNQKFLDRTWKIRNMFAKLKYRIKYGKTNDNGYHIYKCKKCGQKIRIPKGKGRIRIKCPKCQYQFKKRS